MKDDIRNECPLECPVKTGEWDICISTFCGKYQAYLKGLKEGIKLTDTFNNLKPDTKKTLTEIIKILGEQENGSK